MKAIRIGNDLSIAWTVNRCGAPENFFGKALKLFLTNRYGKIPVGSFSLKKNVIEFVFAGREQRELGEYGLLLIENDNAADMYTVDVSRAFALTLSNDPLCRCTSEVHLTSDIALPVNGLSAYELAVKHGYEGTEEEWVDHLNLPLEKGEGEGSVKYTNAKEAEGIGSFALGAGSEVRGNFSVAMGYNTSAAGDSSFVAGVGGKAEGDNSAAFNDSCLAGGRRAFAEGHSTVANGESSHAEGDHTIANGAASHAEGCNTTARGYYSHAEGYGTATNNEAEHAQGKYNVSTPRKTIHSVGIGSDGNHRRNAEEIHADGRHFIIDIGGYDGTNSTDKNTESVQDVIGGLVETLSSSNYFRRVDTIPDSWAGQYLIVCEEKNVAFNGSLDNLDVPNNVIPVVPASGQILATKELLSYTFTIDEAGTFIRSASGFYIGNSSDSNALKQDKKYENAISFVDNDLRIVSAKSVLRYNATSGQTRFRYYKSTTFEAQNTIALYRLETGNGILKDIEDLQDSIDDLQDNKQDRLTSGSITNDLLASDSVTTEKMKDKSVTPEKLAENSNLNTEAKDYTGAINELNEEVGRLSEVPLKKGSGNNSVKQTTAKGAGGVGSVALGENTEAPGQYSFSCGRGTTAKGEYSHAEGTETTADGTRSHAEGMSSKATGDGSHAEGYATIAEGGYSHTEGSGTKALNGTEHAQGKYNLPKRGKTIHTIGIGSGDNDRKNAEEVHTDGRKFLLGVGGYDGTNSETAKPVQEVLANMVDLDSEQTISGAKTFMAALMAKAGLNMVNTRIRKLGAPKDADDAATKAYVDALIQRLEAAEAKITELQNTLNEITITSEE